MDFRDYREYMGGADVTLEKLKKNMKQVTMKK